MSPTPTQNLQPHVLFSVDATNCVFMKSISDVIKKDKKNLEERNGESIKQSAYGGDAFHFLVILILFRPSGYQTELL
jgi:hypothetical protein